MGRHYGNPCRLCPAPLETFRIVFFSSVFVFKLDFNATQCLSPKWFFFLGACAFKRTGRKQQRGGVTSPYLMQPLAPHSTHLLTSVKEGPPCKPYCTELVFCFFLPLTASQVNSSLTFWVGARYKYWYAQRAKYMRDRECEQEQVRARERERTHLYTSAA